jgi:hypothetical protein
MNPLQSYYNSLEKTDLTYLTSKQQVQSMLGVTAKQKSKIIVSKQEKFLQNLKVLRENEGRTDLKGKSLIHKLVSINKKLVKDIYKIRKASDLDNQIIEEYEEFLALEINQDKDLFQFIIEEVDYYKRYVSVYTSPEQKADEIIKKNSKAFVEAITWEIEDNWSIADFKRQFGTFLETNELSIIKKRVSLEI